MRRAVRLAALACATAAAALFVMAHFADRLIFLPPPSSYGTGTEGLVMLPTATGDSVGAIVAPAAASSVAAHAPAPAATHAVLFTHGNAEDAGHQVPFLEIYRSLGVTVLAVDYPGYGLSTGVPSEPGAYAAADAALAHLGALGFPPERVVLHGRSLGGAVVVDVAARHRVAGLILESTFTSAFQVMLPFGGLPGDRFTSLAKLPRVTAPTLVIHGTRDEVIPFSHGQRIFRAFPPGQARSWWVEGAGHNDLMWVAGERYWREVASFLAQVTGAGERAEEDRP
jgi:fermentation-respiration switch protein FrsA (DUF1100 family)